LNDPERGDYRPRAGSAAEAYGCQTFTAANPNFAIGKKDDLKPRAGLILSGVEIQVGGIINEDTTWDAPVVRVTESVEVASNAALTIAPGTRVEFAGHYKLLVHGRLWAVGTPRNRIEFTAVEEQQTIGWDGIEFLNIPAANDFSRLEHCDLSYAVAKPNEENTEERIIGGTSRPETGGAVSVVGVDKLVIAACVFTNNRADFGGAIYCGYGASPVLAGNLFYDNTALWQGSALFNVYAYPKLINNTIVNNECLAESSFHLCGAVDSFNGKVLLLGNIIRDNFTNHYSEAQLFVIKDYYTTANNIAAYEGSPPNGDFDPDFRGYGEFPFQLMEISRCIDSVPDDPLSKMLAEYDIAGNERLFGQTIDMGAFEYSGSVSSAPQVSPALPGPTLSCAPNPFNPRTKIVFDLPVGCQVKLKIFDLRGKHVKTLVDEHLIASQHGIIWDGSDEDGRASASGTYRYQLTADQVMISRTMTLIR